MDTCTPNFLTMNEYLLTLYNREIFSESYVFHLYFDRICDILLLSDLEKLIVNLCRS